MRDGLVRSAQRVHGLGAPQVVEPERKLRLPRAVTVGGAHDHILGVSREHRQHSLYEDLERRGEKHAADASRSDLGQRDDVAIPGEVHRGHRERPQPPSGRRHVARHHGHARPWVELRRRGRQPRRLEPRTVHRELEKCIGVCRYGCVKRVAELGALLGRLLRSQRRIPRRHERLLLRTLHTQRLLRHDNSNLGGLLGYANANLGNGRDGLEIHTLSSRAQCASLPLELVCVLCCVLLELRSLGVLACGRSNSVRLRNGLTCLCCRLLLELLSLRSRLLFELCKHGVPTEKIKVARMCEGAVLL